MVTTLFRIIKYGLQSFWRNGLLSAATIIVMVLALLVFEGLIIFGVLTGTATESLKDKIDISVYFKSSVNEDEILKIKKSLESLKEVKEVEYVSSDDALELFKEKYKDDEAISQALRELESNPLLASLNIKANDPSQFAAIAAYLENENFKKVTERITFTQSKLAIERLTKIVSTFQKLGLLLTVFLALTAILVAFNTIRLAIYSNREEIGIMRLVGASNIFINGPYVIEAIIFGILSAILSLIISWPFINYSSPYIQSFIPEMSLENYFFSNLLPLFGYQLLFGIFLGIISAVVAIRRYLKL